ncbi:uncharacterized protein NDAI_0J01120 [Naumovozyma dairenensis CBS 421]|uniref:F-box domain-containing protein n=1 Tax=Naumovozyma dairenensis (strain ATCC 10597 / BCRC 20456 / CBS 421 / NBRC 0211 / NRRL Y-12639) TaxID=1071378 RepID=G0WGS6_NAUDC|nr:hypothetical protein NDAI_0J01120 [Naumovozyma dairenensis CBS 421]CCD27004.1 hypothetical protein NDAI_0J01120 [Naumovozyma dairenensis CBS 421]
MLTKLPSEIYDRVLSLLPQHDKVSLTYLSHKIYDLTLPKLYQNLYLNDRYYFPSDYDPSLGTQKWSILRFSYIETNDKSKEFQMNYDVAVHKFQCLVDTLKNSPNKICPYIKRIHTTWHIDDDTLLLFLETIRKFAINLQSFENFLKNRVSDELESKADNLQSLTIIPPKILPTGVASPSYFIRMRKIINLYSFDNLQKLNIHVNACTFFKEKVKKPLRIESLTLNLRSDTYGAEGLQNQVSYYDIFDIASLKELEILSWYNTKDSDLDLYQMWNLTDFYKFLNIEILSLLSINSSESFLKECSNSFHSLKRLKVDFLLDKTLSQPLVNHIAMSPAGKSLKYLDIKFDQVNINIPLLSVEQVDESWHFKIDMNCKCESCHETFRNVILRKYFPTTNSFNVKDSYDIETRNFILHMFKLYPILPHTHFIDINPSLGYNCKPLASHVLNINTLLKYNDCNNTTLKITETDIIKLYHAYLHSFKKIFDFFIQSFGNLQYLVINDLPTKIIQFDEQQKCAMPLFYSHGYKSNQVYEIVNDDSLFD